MGTDNGAARVLGRSGIVVSAALFLALQGCGGLSKTEKKTDPTTGVTLQHLTVQMSGDLVGLDFWEGGFDVFAVGENAAGEPLAFADGSKRAPVGLSHSGDPVPIGLMIFDLPAGATKWRIEVDSIVGRACTFTPSSGLVADIGAPPAAALLDANYTIASSCTTEWKVSGKVDMEVEGLVIKMNDESFTVSAAGDPAAFTFTSTGDRTYADVKDGGSVIKGNAKAYWSGSNLEATSPMIADFTMSAKTPDGNPCKVDPSANRFEEKVTFTGVTIPPPYVKIFNRLKAVDIKCKQEPTLTVGGTVKDLDGTLVLATAAGDTVTVTTDETSSPTFTFPKKLFEGDAYAVTISKQPAQQTCSIASGATGTASANVTNVAITCTVNTYSMGGSVAGQSGAFVVSAGDKTVDVGAADTTFAVAGLPALGAYTLAVTTQPAGQTCTVAAAGTTTSLEGDVTTANITCVNSASYTLGGTSTGISSGHVILQDFDQPTATKYVTVSDDTGFTFPGTRDDGYNYQVDIVPMSNTTGKNCVLTNNDGTVAGANVTNITITCN